METIINCPVCEGTNFSLFLECKDYTVSKALFTINSCNQCGFKFTSPRPTDSESGKYYESDEYISHTNSSKGLLNGIYQIVRKHTLKNKLALINFFISTSQQQEERTILDFGCGTGEFLNSCKQDGWKTKGIEPSKNAREFGMKNYQLELNERLDENNYLDGSFNIITLWHVLEHVHELNKTIEIMKKKLSKNGTMIIAVPNCDSLDAKIYGKHWAAYDVPRHIYHFTPDTIQKLFYKHGFKMKKILPMNFDSFYVSLLSEKIMNEGQGKSDGRIIKLLFGFLNGLRSNLNSMKNEGTCSSQIYIFKQQK